MASKLTSFLAELKRRKVYRVAGAYVIVGAVLAGAANDILPRLGLPEWTVSFVVILLLLGFPLAVALAWAYEVRPEEARTAHVEESETVAPAGIPSPAAPPTPGALEDGARKSVAVLPFLDMSPGQDQEYFCDGMAEELINALTRVRGLRVAARTSSFHFKGRSEDVREIGKRLAVRSVLEGSVRRAGDRLRVTAQLVSVEDGYHLWSETYDRELKDVFAIQDEISRSIAETLRPKLLGENASAPGEQEGELVVAPTRSLEAYDEYLLGRHYWENRYKAGLSTALRHFQKAVELDPEFALPYTGVADTYTVLGLMEYLRPDEARHRAGAAARRALELDDSLADAHASMGLYQFWLAWDWEGAALEFLKAIELNPEHAKAHVWLGLLRAEQGRCEEAFDEVGIAQSLDPLSSYIAMLTACVHAEVGDPADAAKLLEPIVARDPEKEPNVLLATFLLEWSYALMSKPDLAVPLGEKAVALSNGAGHFRAALGMSYAQAGMINEARTVLEELRSRRGSQHVSPLWLCWIHLGLGELDQVVELFARVVAERSPYAHAVTQERQWQPLWSDPRFIELASKVGSGVVSPAWERARKE